MKPKWKVGDELIIIDINHPNYGSVKTVESLEDGIVWTDKCKGIGYHPTGAGRLGKESDKKMMRKITKLEKVLK